MSSARASRTLQVVAALAAITVVMVVGRGRTFFFDEWDWVQHRSYGGLETLMRPHNGHLMPLPVALYRLQFEVVGFAPAWPVRLVTIAAHVAAAGVLYRLARERLVAPAPRRSPSSSSVSGRPGRRCSLE